MTTLKLSARPARAARPAAPAARMPSPQAWERLLEDLEGAAECNRAQEEELEAVRAELGHTQQQLADEQHLRGLCDDLVGSLFRQREYHAGHARYAYEQLALVAAANRRALDVIRDLRAQAHGLEPRPPAAGAVAVRSN